jgi:hypothetical protein
VSRLAHPLVQQKTTILCKRFCNGNNAYYRCTVDPVWGRQENDASLCDWGNNSYAWMLEDLTGPNRLRAYKAENNARLTTYFYAIAHSPAFYERWKDFRFNRRVRVPGYIQQISPWAGRTYMGLIARDPIEKIAQEVRQPVEKVEDVAERIIIELTERGKMYLLDAPKTISLTQMGDEEEDPEGEGVVANVADSSWDPVNEELQRKMTEALKKLDPVERAVLEEMVVEGREATDVLKGLVRAGISIKEGVPPEKINEQQLFYFKRKTLAKLKDLMELSDEG